MYLLKCQFLSLFEYRFFSLLLFVLSMQAIALGDDFPENPHAVPVLQNGVHVITGELHLNTLDLKFDNLPGLILERAYCPPQRMESRMIKEWRTFPFDLFDRNADEPHAMDISSYHLEFSYDINHQITDIQVYNREGTLKLDHIYIRFHNDEKPSLEITTDSGNSVIYLLDRQFSFSPFPSTYVLKEVLIQKKLEAHYEYRDHPTERRKLLVKVEDVLGNALLLDYYIRQDLPEKDTDQSFCIGMVKSLSKKTLLDASPILLAQYVYKGKETWVQEANLRQTVYRYLSTQHLTEKEERYGNGESYRLQKFYWRKGNLIGRALSDGSGLVSQGWIFEYNKKHQITKEILYGNLSGSNPSFITLDADGHFTNPDVETYTKSYTYSKDKKPLLIKQEEDNGSWIQFIYDPIHKYLTGKLIGDKSDTHQREFYLYNENGLLKRTIKDDGHSTLQEELTGVTERHCIDILDYSPYPCSCLPTVIEEKCLDISTGKDILVKKTFNVFSKQGLLLRSDTYDDKGDRRFLQMNDYDLFGKLVRTSGLYGNVVAKKYDPVGHLIEEWDSASNRTIRYEYDLAQRLIKHQIIDGDTQETSVTYRYNPYDEKISAIDTGGNETLFFYDAFHRLTKTLSPYVLDENGQSIQPLTKLKYDLWGRVTTTIDAKGNSTHNSYNARGQAIEKTNCKGSKESILYWLDGLKQLEVAKDGTRTHYVYDGLKRVIEKRVLDSSGTLLNHSQSIYKGMHLISLIQPQQTLHFQYNPQGQKTVVEKATAESQLKTEYLYDNYGELRGTKEWWGSGPEDYSLIISEKDDQARVTQLSIQDAHGNVLKTSAVPKKPKESNSSKSLVLNDRQQWVWQHREVDKRGVQTLTTYDALGRIEMLIKKNTLGKEVEHIDFRYDANGNQCKSSYSIIIDGNVTGHYTICRKYSSDNLLEEIVEGPGSKQEKHTRYLHDLAGRVVNLIKPDGMEIHYGYDDAGRLIQFYASDSSFDYSYAYDSYGNIHEAEDRIHQQKNLRDYDINHQVIQETLGHGYTLKKNYDSKGRIQNLIFADQSSVEYLYDAAYLREVIRKDPKNNLLYRHAYSAFDQQGSLSKAQMIQDLGEMTYKIDADGNEVSLQTPYWSSSKQGHSTCSSDSVGQYEGKILVDDLNRITEEIGTENSIYRYDSLGNRIQDSRHPYQYNALNQLTRFGDAQLDYDLNGNLIASPRMKYRYDALNRLVEIEKDNGTKIEYVYDPFNRRIEKRGSFSQQFIFNGDLELGTLSPSGHIKQLRILGQGLGAEIGAAIAMEFDGYVYACIHDLNGSVACLIDPATKNVVESYRYTAFGKEHIFDGHGKKIVESVIGNPWRYQGKRKDAETGWTFFGKRYYASQWGRWTSPDPLGHADGPNLYAYVQNNPADHMDLFGLFTLWKAWGALKQGFYEFCERLFGETFLTHIGYHSQHNTTGVWGNGEVSDKVRVTFINGILTLPIYFDEHLQELSDLHGGVNVHFIYRSTWGWGGDLVRCLLVKYGLYSVEAQLLAETWKKLIQEMGGSEGGGVIYHYAHSIGSSESEKAYNMLTPEEQTMIHIITFGSPSLLKNTQDHHKFTNYIGLRDGIPLLDPLSFLLGLLGYQDNIIFIGEMNGFPLVDHYLLFSAYHAILQILGQRFVEMYGTVDI